MKKYQEEMRSLSVLRAHGKIGEKSYLAATGTLNHEIEKLKKIKENQNVSLTDATIFQSGEFEADQVDQIRKPTALWYLAPFFFGIIGGLVGYVGTKDEDKGMANNLLLFGVLWSIILILIGIVIYFSILASILSHSSAGLALAVSVI